MLRFTYHGQAADDVQISPDLCLIGCVFFFSDHLSKQTPKEMDFKARLARWKANICNHGGLVEETYNKVTCTHVVADEFDSEDVKVRAPHFPVSD